MYENVVKTFVTTVGLGLGFLARDAMHKRGLCRHAVSVHPSVTFVDHVKTKIIFKIFSPSGSHIILVFQYQTSWQYSDGEPLTWASSASGVGKNCCLAPSRAVNGSTAK